MGRGAEAVELSPPFFPKRKPSRGKKKTIALNEKKKGECPQPERMIALNEKEKHTVRFAAYAASNNVYIYRIYMKYIWSKRR